MVPPNVVTLYTLNQLIKQANTSQNTHLKCLPLYCVLKSTFINRLRMSTFSPLTLTLNIVMYYMIIRIMVKKKNTPSVEKNSCLTTSPEQVLCSGSHPHLLVDLLVDASSSVLQFTALSLGERITPLHRKQRKRGRQKKWQINERWITANVTIAAEELKSLHQLSCVRWVKSYHTGPI